MTDHDGTPVTFHKEGSGLLKLGTSNHTGGTIVHAGILQLTGGGKSGGIRGTLTVEAGATARLSAGDALGWGGGATTVQEINLNGGILESTGNSNQTTTAAIHLTGGKITGDKNLDLFTQGGSKASVTTHASNDTSVIEAISINLRQDDTVFDVADGNAETDLLIKSRIGNGAGGNHNLVKTGGGTMVLSGANNSFSGGITVNEGTLGVTGFQGLLNVPSITVNQGSTLMTNATNIFVTGHDVKLADSHVIALNDGSTWILGNSGDYRVGNVLLNQGAEWESKRAVGGWGVLLGDTVSGAATISVTGSGASHMTGNGSTGINIQGVQNFDVADTAELQVSMVLANPGMVGGADGGIRKLGDGAMIISSASTYSGDTIVSAGSLYVTGSLGATTVRVESGAGLGGYGNLGGDLYFDEHSSLDVTIGILTLSDLDQNVTFGGFDFDDIVGLATLLGGSLNDATPGSHQLISGGFSLDSSNISHFGIGNALSLTNGNKAYFDGENGLRLIVIPELGTTLLSSLGLLTLLVRRRAS